MSAIGIDTHKDSLAACAVDELGTMLAEAEFANDPAGHAALAAWTRTVAAGATIGVEGSSSYGAAAARYLDGRGLPVREVPLMGQERRALHEKRRKRRHADIGHNVLDVLPAPLVRQTRAGRPQPRYKVFDRSHTALESDSP